MKLYYSTSSPFVRKVNVVAIETGLDNRIERVLTNPWVHDAALISDNPLSKVPTLVTDDGLVIYDSPVICEYLDSLHHGQKMIPASGSPRWIALRMQALADGILEAAVLRFLERGREPAQRSADWDAKQKQVITHGLIYLNEHVTQWQKNTDIGQISVACALGYLDFRFADDAWRESARRLADWFAEYAQRPAMMSTIPKQMPVQVKAV